MPFTLRDASAFDADNIHTLIFGHGPNPWNWLPPEGVAQTIQQLVAGQAAGVLLEEQQQLAGVVLYCFADPYPALRPADIPASRAGYIIEAVVHGGYAGQGLGARLLGAACQALAAKGAQWIVADRHEENAASAGMMRKAGFAQLALFDEPERRPHGSRRTAVCGRRS